MNRLTKQYADTKRYYSTHNCDEVVQRLGELEDKATPKKPYYSSYCFRVSNWKCTSCDYSNCCSFRVGGWECTSCDGSVKAGDVYCSKCGQKLDWSGVENDRS